MSNIYDIFNERKNAVSMISEGFDYDYYDMDTIESFDTIEEGIDVLTDLQREMQNTAIKVCAESLVSDLLLENAMYEEFDEFAIEDMIEESLKEKASNVGKRIQEMWAKIRAWFSNLFTSIANHFANGEKLAKKYPDLKNKIKSDTGTVKCYDLIGADLGIAKCNTITADVKFDDAYNYSGDYKTEIFKKMGVSDKKELKKKVMSFFVKNGDFEKKEMKISSLPAEIVFDYAVSKKDIIDGLKNQQKIIDGDFNSAKSAAKDNRAEAKGKENKEARQYINDAISVLNFMMNVKTDIIKVEIAVVKKLSGVCMQICRHAIGGAKPEKADNDKKEEPAKESFDYLMNSLDEDVEFDDDDFGWDL